MIPILQVAGIAFAEQDPEEAARLLDQKNTKDAGNVLLTALNTLVVVDSSGRPSHSATSRCCQRCDQ